MNGQRLKLARALLGLNQTEFAALLGWTSKKNIGSLERGEKKVTVQTALAVECLLRRNNKFGDFEMIKNMQPVLKFILVEIERKNTERQDGSTISDDETNEELVDIFFDVGNKFAYLDFELKDDEDYLTSLFGYDGYCAIRDAEQGNY